MVNSYFIVLSLIIFPRIFTWLNEEDPHCYGFKELLNLFTVFGLFVEYGTMPTQRVPVLTRLQYNFLQPEHGLVPQASLQYLLGSQILSLGLALQACPYGATNLLRHLSHMATALM